ncbi:MAG: hypothetical protein AAB875_02670 [Patescibacteria group bacterium]
MTARIEEDYDSDVYECGRCEQGNCQKCNPLKEVDFEIEDAVFEYGEEVNKQWKGQEVCPFCYNQLVEKKGAT